MQHNRWLEGFKAVNKSNCQPWCYRVKACCGLRRLFSGPWDWMGSNGAPVRIKIKIKVKRWSFCTTDIWTLAVAVNKQETVAQKKKKISGGSTILVARLSINLISIAPFTWQPVTNKHLPRNQWFTNIIWCLHTIVVCVWVVLPSESTPFLYLTPSSP